MRYLCLSELYRPCQGGHVVYLHEVFRRLGEACVVTGMTPSVPPHQIVDGVEIRRIDLRRWPLLRPEDERLRATRNAGRSKNAPARRPSSGRRKKSEIC